jgi:hypothetical protein
MLADMQVVENILDKAQRLARSGDKEAIARGAVLQKCKSCLDTSNPIRSLDLEEEERRSKTEVYHGEDSIGKRALQRVLLRKQLDAMRAELREIMVYQSPPELGALWTEVEAMMEIVGKEQAVAIGIEMRRNAEAARRKRKQIKKIKYTALCWSMSSLAVLYFCWLVWAVVQVRIEMYPELGRCLVPRGQWPYEHYNKLKWIECEIK